MVIKRIISALLVVVLGVAFVVPSFALAAEDDGEVVGDALDVVASPDSAVSEDGAGDEGIMLLASASVPSGSLADFFGLTRRGSSNYLYAYSTESAFLSHFPDLSATYTYYISPSPDTSTGFFYRWDFRLYGFEGAASNGDFRYRVYFYGTLTAPDGSVSTGVPRYQSTSTSPTYRGAIYFSRDIPSFWDSLPHLASNPTMYGSASLEWYPQSLSSSALPDSLQSPTSIADSIASNPSAVQSLAGALAEAGLGGSDPNEIWGQSLVANNHIYVTNGSYSLGNFTAAGALDNLMNNIAYSVPFGLTGTLVNVNGIYPTGTHDGPTVAVGSVSTSPLQALLDAIIYSPLTTAKRWVWNGSLEPPTLESTSTITESQAMAENFHSLGVFLNNENTAIKSLISSEVGYGSFDIHEITSDGVVTTTHENVGSIVGALSVMSNDITGMLSNLGFVLADPDDMKLKQDTKQETEAATESLYGENGLSKSDNFKQSNDLGSVGGILTPQYDIKDIAGATDNENLWAWFSAETWATAFNVPSVLAEGDEDEPLYQPDSEKWGSAEWKFGDR